MGVLYEHWRPDLNECFYVGISWANEETRPWEMNHRNRRHISVQEELFEKGLVAEVKIQAEDLNKYELCELEKLQISYWRDLIGDRLKNMHAGGVWEDGFNDDDREVISQTLIDYYNSPEGEIAKNKLRVFQKEHRPKFINSPKGEAWRKSESLRMTSFYETDAGDQFKIEQSLRMQGENHPCVKLTTEVAQKILDFEGTHKEAAAEFGVKYSRALMIRTRKQWKHLTPSIKQVP